MPSPVSLNRAHHFSISGCNLGNVGRDYLVVTSSDSESESLDYLSRSHDRRRSKRKSQKTQGSRSSITPSLSLRSSFTATRESDYSEPRAFPPEAPTHRMSSLQTLHSPIERPQNPSPPSIYSYGSSLDDGRPRRGEDQNATSTQSPLPYTSADPPSHLIRPPAQYIWPQTNYTCPQPLALPAPVYLSHATGLNANIMPAEAVRAQWMALHLTPHRGTSPYDIEYVSQYGDAAGRNNQRPLWR